MFFLSRLLYKINLSLMCLGSVPAFTGILSNMHCYMLSFSSDPSKTNSRTKASVGFFLQAGRWCCYRAHPVSRSNERWVEQPGYQYSGAFTPEMMICYFCSLKQTPKLIKTLLVCSRCLGTTYFYSFNFSAGIHLYSEYWKTYLFDPPPLHVIGHKSSVNRVAFEVGTIKHSTQEPQ